MNQNAMKGIGGALLLLVSQGITNGGVPQTKEGWTGLGATVLGGILLMLFAPKPKKQ